jgi:hypothetical protein
MQKKKTTIAADVNVNAQDIMMAQRVQSKAKSNKKRRQNQKRRNNAAACKKKLNVDAAEKEGKMAAVIRLFSPRSSGNGTAGGGVVSLFSPNAKKTKSVKKEEAPVEEIPSVVEAPSVETADDTVGTAEDAADSVEMATADNIVAAVAAEAEAEVVEEEEKEPVNLLGKGTNAPSDECNLQQCIIL